MRDNLQDAARLCRKVQRQRLPHAIAAPMPSLLDKALAALDEAATEAATHPIRHTKALAFVFAYLSAQAADEAFLAELRRQDPKAYFTPPEQRVFVDLWNDLAAPLASNDARDHGRRQTINSLAGYVFRMFGRVR